MNDFWRKNICDPLSWLWQTCIKPVSYQKFIETLPDDEVKRRFKRIILPFFILALLLNPVAVYGFSLSLPAADLSWIFLVAFIIYELGVLHLYQRSIKEFKNASYWSEKIIGGVSSFLIFPLMLSWFSFVQVKSPSILSVIFGIVVGLLIGLNSSAKREKLKDVITYMIVGSTVLILFSTSFASFNYLALAVTGIIFYAFSALRLINWARTSASIRQANRKSRREPHRAAEFLQKCAFWQDEFGTLPYPGLRELLRRAALHDWAATYPQLVELIRNHPQQANVARLVIIETLTLDWMQRRTVLDIAGALERLHTMLPNRTILHNLHVQFIIDYLAEVSEHARKYCEKFGVEAALSELENMEYRLNTVTTRLAHERVPGDKHLKRVVTLWRTAVTNEIQRARTAQWQIIQ
jgi:hypothetical protein